MLALAVTVWVKPEHAEAFIEATRANGAGARAEPGNVRFDLCRAADDPNRFFLYEVYRDAAALEAHRQTPHYLRWREQVADWMAQPRQGLQHCLLDPLDDPDLIP